MKRNRMLGCLLSATAVVMLSNLVEPGRVMGQGVAQRPPPAARAKTIKCNGRVIPQLADITKTAGIHFTHSSAPENRYIVESMSGGVLLIDYDRDGWPDIYLTCLGGNVLYHNNCDGSSPMSQPRRE